MPDLLSLTDLARADLERIFARARDWKSGTALPIGPGPRIATIFNGPAFRTRLAFDTAIDRLGGHRVDLPLILGEREPIADTAAILADALDAVIIRHRDHHQVRELAQEATVPVINAMTGLGHPCEVISEAFTVLERHGSLDGLRVTFVGEPTNLFRSWCELGTRFDLAITQVAPKNYLATAAHLHKLREAGTRVETTTDLVAGVRAADVVYTDGWPEAAQVPGPVRDAFLSTQITTSVYEHMAADGVLMHCMPVRRGDEVDAAAFAHARSITRMAKTNLGPTHTAILEHALGR